jgi:hypothetical protein
MLGVSTRAGHRPAKSACKEGVCVVWAQQDRIRKLCRALYAASVRLRHPDTLSIESLCDEVEPSHEVPLTQEVPLTSLCVPVVERVDVSRVER